MRARRDAIARTQADGDLFVAASGERLEGGATLSARPGPIWADCPEPGAQYLGTLVVARECAGRRLGEQLLAELESIARARGATEVRLDCVASNESLARYYQRLGYYPRGVVHGGDVALLRHDKRLGAPPDAVVASLRDVDFERWRPDRVATLLFVVHDGRILLIHKKRGHGAGKINGPGGMVEPGETPLACALRETFEEVGVQARGVTPLAELRFQDTDGTSLLGYAVLATDCDGTPHETAEAMPFWCPLGEIPYDAMWEDDRLWLPYLLDGAPVIGEFLMHGDRLIEHALRRTSAARLARLVGLPIT
jgi:8-oxo-dGTP diphosphatase